MNDHQRQLLAICAQAQTDIRRAYSATFFAHRHISIIDQQSRSLNLCWALTKTRRITSKSHVAIAGGGISGMTCAVALALWSNCMVYVFEKDRVLLKRFREAAHRYIHPDLNHTGGLDRSIAGDPYRATDFPFMNWYGDYAPHFAEQLIREFDHYRASTNIALYLGTAIQRVFPQSRGVELAIEGHPANTARFDAAILATGFGEESFDSHTNDTSYWHTGNPRQYRASPLLRKDATEKVLISGNGDSGVIELAHLLLKNFSHRDIFGFLPTNQLGRRFGDEYAVTIDAQMHRKIEYDANREGDHGPIGWYWSTREMLTLNPQLRGFGDSPQGHFSRQFYAAADRRLRRFANDSAIPDDERSAIEKGLFATLTTLGSREIQLWLGAIDLRRVFSRKVRTVFRKNVEVTMLGRTPTIYSPGQAPLNWFLLRVLCEYGAITYQQAHIKKCSLVRNQSHCEVAPKNGRPWVKVFDRVITRHGPEFAGLSNDLRQSKRASSKTPTRFRASLPIRPANHLDYCPVELRNARLTKAKSTVFPLTDIAESDPLHVTLLSVRRQVMQADNALWLCFGKPTLPEATQLYRRFKREIDPKKRSKLIGMLLRQFYNAD